MNKQTDGGGTFVDGMRWGRWCRSFSLWILALGPNMVEERLDDNDNDGKYDISWELRV